MQILTGWLEEDKEKEKAGMAQQEKSKSFCFDTFVITIDGQLD